VRPGALLFAAALGGAVAAWLAAVRPAAGEAAALADAIEATDFRARREAAARWGGPSEEEVRRLAEASAALRPPVAAPRPAGIREEEPGTFRGRVRWTEVQDLFAWASSAGRPVLEVEVRARADDPERAECRVVLAPEAAR
jgi:hypothetical protein